MPRLLTLVQSIGVILVTTEPVVPTPMAMAIQTPIRVHRLTLMVTQILTQPTQNSGVTAMVMGLVISRRN